MSERIVSRLVPILGFVVLEMVGPARAGPTNGAPASRRDGVVLMAFHDGISEARQRAILRSIGARHVKHLGACAEMLSVGPGGIDDAIRSLRAWPEVRYAEPDLVQSLNAGALPNDTSIGRQWAPQNTGQIVNGVAGTPGA